MGIDIRATVTCSLGTLISATVNDDYIQGSGLIKTKGSCEISGLISPAVGTVATFSYTKSGITRSVPRKLRVLSSFADPYRRTTKVELGCKLTYLQDLKDPIKWNAFNDPENEDFDQNDARIVVIPIYASSVANECLTRLGLSATNLALSNRFSVDEFDFSPGYVQILSDLLVSESRCGYLDSSEILRVFSLDSAGGSGPSFDDSKVIDVAPIGVGELAGDSVVVSYNTLKLKAPEGEEVACRDAADDTEDTDELESSWGADITTSTSEGKTTYAYKLFNEGETINKTYVWLESAREETYYGLFDVFESGRVRSAGSTTGSPTVPDAIDGFVVERRNLVKTRIITQKTGSAAIAGGYAQQSLSNGFDFNNFDVSKTTIEKFSYDSYGNESLRTAVTYGSLLFLYGSAGIDLVYTDDNGAVSRVSLGQGEGQLEKIEVYSSTSGRFTKRVTKRYGPWAETISGQQAIANAREAITTVAEAETFLNTLFGGLYLIDVTVETSVTGSRGAQEVPSDEEVAKQDLADDGDPDNGFTTESTSELELALGSSTATRRIELSMPYAPDDTFTRVIDSPDPLRYCYYSSKSDAESKAALFGRVQNRILFGNRNGMNIQTVPENLPTAPFGPFYLTANGVVTQYRTNGTSWTMDSEGIVASTDGLYWGVVGRTA
jgi:hypothetical protein